MDQRSARRRSPANPVPPYRNKRFLAILAAVLTFGAFVTVTQVSNAGTRRHRPPVAKPTCPPAATPTSTGTAQQPAAGANPQAAPPAQAGDPLPPVTTATKGPGDIPKAGQTDGVVDGGVQNGAPVRHYPNDGGTDVRRGDQTRCTPNSGTPSPTTTGPTSPPAQPDPLAVDCSDSNLQAHRGFQEGPRCVSVAHGEVPAAENAPSVLIVGAPRVVRANQPFTIQISSRNLVRDRFLGAAVGGYYHETSLLVTEGPNAGLVRGHLHTACERLARVDQAPDRNPVPAFFVATEDSRGGRTPDVVTINIPGLAAGIYSCGTWAGDGSHRTPMAQRANQRTAFDAVRILVRA
jgi:hypothetical protein